MRKPTYNCEKCQKYWEKLEKYWKDLADALEYIHLYCPACKPRRVRRW